MTRGRADYADRLEARRERLENGAAKASAEADGRFAKVRQMAGIIQGEPVKHGHHSEKRHRRDLARMDTNVHLGVVASKKADSLASAAAAVGTGGISSDDPEAIEKLRAELAKLTAKREQIKAASKAWRKATTTEQREALIESIGVRESTRAAMRSLGSDEKLVPSYVLTNLGANIRRIEARIAELSKPAPDFAPILDGGWFRIVARHDINRIALTADRRVSEESYAHLKRSGWRWSPTEGSFLVGLHNRGVHLAHEAARVLGAEVAS
jgi:hypothetical protein